MRNLWRAFKLVLPHRGMLVWYGLTAFGLALFGSVPLVLAKSFLNKLNHQEPKDRLGIFVDGWLEHFFGFGPNYLWGLCAVILVMWTLKSILDFLNTYIASWLAQRLRTEAMEKVMERLLTLDQPYFDRQKTGDLVSRMVSDGDNLRKTVKIFLDFLQQPFIVISLAGLAIYYDWMLFFAGAIGVPLLVWPLTRVIKNITKQTRRYQEKTADLAQAMLQNLSGIRIIHAYDAAKTEAGNFNKAADSLFRTGMRRNMSRAAQRPMASIMLGFGGIAVLLTGGLRVLANPERDPADFMVFIAALGMLYAPATAMMLTLGELAEFLPSAERTFAILDEKPTVVDPPNAAVCPRFSRELVFENVSFDYGRGPILKNFSLTVRAGEKIGIVGRTGVGKSTLLSLLMRFYDPSAGRILIDGVDIRTVSLASLRAQIALVNQTPFLFHATVADNIRYGRSSATDAEVIDAAKTAMVHDEIMQQPLRYETLCGERGGELFSGGQRQRISVARAVLRNAPILLLDEATSALDAFSERRVQEALETLAANRTSLIVAHRLSTLDNADRIVVFGDSGGVEAIGTRAELLTLSPTYRLLSQMPGGVAASGQS